MINIIPEKSKQLNPTGQLTPKIIEKIESEVFGLYD